LWKQAHYTARGGEWAIQRLTELLCVLDALSSTNKWRQIPRNLIFGETDWLVPSKEF